MANNNMTTTTAAAAAETTKRRRKKVYKFGQEGREACWSALEDSFHRFEIDYDNREYTYRVIYCLRANVVAKNAISRDAGERISSFW